MAADLPLELAEAVERLLEDVSPRDLARASADLSERYRQKRGRRAPIARAEADIQADPASRLPATYAAINASLQAVREQRSGWTPRTMLDLGAGPGTGLWSATAVWPTIELARAVEAEPGMIEVGQTLAREASHGAVRGAV